MHDPKFEQEVQRRMHDLEFVPSESVWAGIQQGIAPRGRRRAVAIFWWLFPGMLLLAGGLVMYRHSDSTGGVAVVVPAAGAVKPAGGTGSTVGNGVGSGAGETGNPVAANGAGGAGNGVAGNGVAGNGTGGVVNRIAGSGTGQTGNGVMDSRVGGTGNEIGGSGAGQTGNEIADRTVAGGEVGAVVARRTSWERYQPALIGGMASRKGIQGPPLNWRPVNTAVSGIGRARHPWSAGFAAGGGVSSIHSATENALVSMAPVISSNYNFAVSGAPRPQLQMLSPTSPGTGGSKQNKTEVKMDYSYWAGIYGEKQLSARWSVDIGLNLHYYSLRFETNNPVAAYAPTSATLFTTTTLTYTPNSANANSNAGMQTYNNRYYFLEVPVTAQWKLNHSRSLPLFLRGGAVLSYLLSSNGLYYDNSSGTYKSDNGVVRRAQAGVNSGLMVGLPIRGMQIQAGPEVQYALTSMLTTGSGGGNMLYGGVRVAVMR